MKVIFLLLLSHIVLFSLDGSAGCRATLYPRSSRYFYTMAPQFVTCACPCEGIVGTNGYCKQCGHTGVLSRGQTEQRHRCGETPDYWDMGRLLD